MEKYDISGMSCAACSARVEKAVKAVPGVTSCSVNLLTNSMSVEGADSESIIRAVQKAGYGASLSGRKKGNDKNENHAHEGESATILTRLVASLALLLILMYISMGHVMWGFPLPPAFAENHIAIALAELLLSAVILVINQHFFINGFKGLIKGAPNMDTLVSLGSLVSFLWSVFLVFKMSFAMLSGESGAHYLHGLYFESAAMILTLITLGKFLEAIAKGKTTNAIKSLLALTPKQARVLKDGREIIIPSSELCVGDVFIVRAGDSFPVDGEVIKGYATADESSLTGESIPVEKSVSAKVYAATVSTSGYLECVARKVGEDTLMSEVVRTVSDAAASKAPIAKVADRVAGIFVPIVISIAFITTLVWFFVNNNLGYALARGISVLVISCPCALGLATPVAIMVGSGIGARGGVLFKTASSIEAVGRAKTVVFDKTGTITCGKAEVADIIPYSMSENELLRLAASLEKKSEHPLAKAIVAYAEKREMKLFDVGEFFTHVGCGVSGKIPNAEIYAGSFKFINDKFSLGEREKELYENLAKEGKTPIFFVKNAELIGVIALADTVREDSSQAISTLKKMGLRAVMLTGDNESTARAVAERVGIDEIIAGVLPAEKARAVTELSKDGNVIMVGDGINDAPALTAADVGISVGRGADIAIESADVVLMNSGISGVVGAVRLGKATLTNIKENLFWAFFYNLIGIPLAAGVFIPLFSWELDPMFGALAMSLSSVCVVTNALRLNLKKIFDKRKTQTRVNETEKEIKKMQIELNVKGMMCPHCEARVKSVIESIDGVISAEADYKSDTVKITLSKAVEKGAFVKAVTEAGYSCDE